MNIKMDEIVKFAKENGFIYPGSDIYGGLANTWDYGPLGIELKNNVKKAWWKKFIQEEKSSYGMDSSILMNPKVWEASGHVGGFSDPLIDCKECKTRHRADHLVETHDSNIDADGMTKDELVEYIDKNAVKCPKCGGFNWTDIREFNLMFETYRGVTEENKTKIFLRPETAQGQFVDFLQIQRSMRAKIPFGVGQVGKVFRNEITPGNFTFRTIEFEQMEYQLFCTPGTDENFYDYYKKKAMNFFTDLGVDASKLKYHKHSKLAHYAKMAHDIMYLFPFGWGEVNGTHNRTNFDLSQHQKHSTVSHMYLDPETNEKYIPYVVESTVGADRATLLFLCDAYTEEKISDEDSRIVLKFHPAIAPYKVAILPLMKKYHQEKADEIYSLLMKEFMVNYDDSGKIGKRYRRQDAIGTPFCITIDDQTNEDDTVTIRDRDTMEQIRIKVEDIVEYVNSKTSY